MVFVKATEDSESGAIASPKIFKAMSTFNEELVNAGVLLAADGLTPSSQGKRVAFDGQGYRLKSTIASGQPSRQIGSVPRPKHAEGR